MLYGSYDPTRVSMSLGSISIVGFAEGTFVKAYRNEDVYSLKVGADGNSTRVRNANRSGRFEFTLLASSPSNDLLQAQATLDELTGGGVAACLVKDASSNAARAQGQNSWVVKIPDLERAKELGEVTWIVETDILELSQSGTTPIPGTA